MLGFEPKERGIMQESPKDIKKESILPNSMLFLVFAISFTVGFSSLIYFWYFNYKMENLALARTIVFATVASVSLVYIFAFKNLKKLMIHTENFFKNKPLFLSIVYGFSLILVAVYMPFFNDVLGTVPLKMWHWLLVFGVAFTTTIMTEAVKMAAKKAEK
jgi:Ca2+-transporting ATPase